MVFSAVWVFIFLPILGSSLKFKEPHYPIATEDDPRECLHLYPVQRSSTYLCAQFLSDPLESATSYLKKFPHVEQTPAQLGKFLRSHMKHDNIAVGEGEIYDVKNFAVGHQMIAIPIRKEDDPDKIAMVRLLYSFCCVQFLYWVFKKP
jgi:hypothetical protein